MSKASQLSRLRFFNWPSSEWRRSDSINRYGTSRRPAKFGFTPAEAKIGRGLWRGGGTEPRYCRGGGNGEVRLKKIATVLSPKSENGHNGIAHMEDPRHLSLVRNGVLKIGMRA